QGGRCLSRPNLEVNRVSQGRADHFQWLENRRKTYCPMRVLRRTDLTLKNDKTSRDIQTTLVRKGKTAAAAPV
ncbi:hypothetical protein, partial [uncultured Maricaulis sp.]|uniref:hypothetical protein n=1 Tax=uncultured Maricaulis sp. TaxID=174710 RepID=UPI0030DA7084